MLKLADTSLIFINPSPSNVKKAVILMPMKVTIIAQEICRDTGFFRLLGIKVL